jgi:GT2 family glycosyltransferase
MDEAINVKLLRGDFLDHTAHSRVLKSSDGAFCINAVLGNQAENGGAWSTMRDITILIKTFERPQCLERLLDSIGRAGWQGPVWVADDSRSPYREQMLAKFGKLVTEYLTMPFDAGSSAGRNLLLRHVTTPYFLLCDDDFIFDTRTDVKRFKDLLESAGLDLIGGVYFDRMHPDWSQAAASLVRLDWWHLCLRLGIEIPRKTFFNFEPCGTNRWRLTDIAYIPPVVRCDYVANFFLARTRRLIETVGGWDESLKMGGHQDFFFRARRAGLQVGHTEEVGVLHLMELPPFYHKFRARSLAMRPKMFADATLAQRLRRTLDHWQRIWKR